jgi:hypothetical protein
MLDSGYDWIWNISNMLYEISSHIIHKKGTLKSLIIRNKLDMHSVEDALQVIFSPRNEILKLFWVVHWFVQKHFIRDIFYREFATLNQGFL